MPKPQPTAAQYAAIMQSLMGTLDFVQRLGLASTDVIDCLVAGRLAAEFEIAREQKNVLPADLSFPQYVALRDIHRQLHAGDLAHQQGCRVRAVLVAMGELEASDA